MNNNALVLGLAGLALYLIWQSQKNKTATTTTAASFVDEIFDQRPYANGWRYFENGVSIDPAGNYYQNGAMVWQSPGAGA